MASPANFYYVGRRPIRKGRPRPRDIYTIGSAFFKVLAPASLWEAGITTLRRTEQIRAGYKETTAARRRSRLRARIWYNRGLTQGRGQRPAYFPGLRRPAKPRIGLEVSLPPAGDSNATDGTHGTFDQSLSRPTNKAIWDDGHLFVGRTIRFLAPSMGYQIQTAQKSLHSGTADYRLNLGSLDPPTIRSNNETKRGRRRGRASSATDGHGLRKK